MLRVCSSLDLSNKKLQDPPTTLPPRYPCITSAIFSTINYYWSQICLLFNVIFFYGNITQSQRSKWKQMTFEAVFKTLFIGWNYFYYINTNEIPGELSRENMISSHVKITCYFFSHVKISSLPWLHYKSRLSQEKTVSLKWFGISLVFT